MKLRFPGLIVAFVLPVILLLAGKPALAGLETGDGLSVSLDSSTDIGDLFAFLDPNDNTQVVLIGTVRGFLIPGKVPVTAAFDDSVKFRFEIYNDHVNLVSPVLSSTSTSRQRASYYAHVKPNRTIDVTFSKREVGDGPQPNGPGTNQIPDNLRRPIQQVATVKLTGFAQTLNKGTYTNLLVTKFNILATASPPFTQSFQATATAQIKFFAGETDDPAFLDEPAFSAYLDTIRNGAPSTSPFSRGRDTYAGYNTLAIALEVPVSLLQGTNGSKLGIDLLAQRHGTESNSAKGRHGLGNFRTIDRAGNPWMTTFLIPYDLQNAYNASTPRFDVMGQFRDALSETLSELGVVSGGASFTEILNLLVAKGDLLQLDTSVANTGTNPSGGFPNGRRVTDDVVDNVLTMLNNGTTLTDNVNANDFSIPTTFPFLALPHQPLFSTSVDDGTRN